MKTLILSLIVFGLLACQPETVAECGPSQQIETIERAQLCKHLAIAEKNQLALGWFGARLRELECEADVVLCPRPTLPPEPEPRWRTPSGVLIPRWMTPPPGSTRVD